MTKKRADLNDESGCEGLLFIGIIVSLIITFINY